MGPAAAKKSTPKAKRASPTISKRGGRKLARTTAAVTDDPSQQKGFAASVDADAELPPRAPTETEETEETEDKEATTGSPPAIKKTEIVRAGANKLPGGGPKRDIVPLSAKLAVTKPAVAAKMPVYVGKPSKPALVNTTGPALVRSNSTGVGSLGGVKLARAGQVVMPASGQAPRFRVGLSRSKPVKPLHVQNA